MSPTALLTCALVFAQPATAPPLPTPRHTGIKALVKDLGQDLKHLPSKENFRIAAIGGGMAFGAHFADKDLNEALVGSDTANKIFKPGAILGQSWMLLSAATTIYAVGRAGDKPRVSHMGMDLLQAVAVSEAITQSLKYTTRRERPDKSSKNSFPSGHSADTFAFATAMERHFGWKGAVPAYMFASYVAISRLPANRHWFSDTVFGAAVGIIAGKTVTRHGRDFPVWVTPIPRGAAVTYSRRF